MNLLHNKSTYTYLNYGGFFILKTNLLILIQNRNMGVLKVSYLGMKMSMA